MILEPGRGMVAESAALVTSVVARATRAGRVWLYLDAGVYNALFEALSCQGATRYRIDAPDARTSETEIVVLAGPTGDGLDVLNEGVPLPADLDVVARVVFHDVGAYNGTLASAFNGFAPAVTHVV